MTPCQESCNATKNVYKININENELNKKKKHCADQYILCTEYVFRSDQNHSCVHICSGNNWNCLRTFSDNNSHFYLHNNHWKTPKMYRALNFYIKQVYYAYTQLLICICITLGMETLWLIKVYFMFQSVVLLFYLLYVYIFYILFKSAIITI